MEKYPRKLEGDERLARARGEREKNAEPTRSDGFQHPDDGDVLIVAPLKISAPVLERDGGEAIPPKVRLRESQVPEFLGAGVMRHFALGAGRHVDGVDPLAVGGVGEADLQLSRVALRLPHAFR